MIMWPAPLITCFPTVHSFHLKLIWKFKQHASPTKNQTNVCMQASWTINNLTQKEKKSKK